MAKSLLNKASLIVFFLVPGEFFTPPEIGQAPCDSIELTVQVTNAEGLQNGSAEAIVSGAAQPIRYLFYKESGQVLSQDINANKVTNVAAGTYFCSILDGKGCIKKTEFKIE
jgi:hypothetical protein